MSRNSIWNVLKFPYVILKIFGFQPFHINKQLHIKKEKYTTQKLVAAFLIIISYWVYANVAKTRYNTNNFINVLGNIFMNMVFFQLGCMLFAAFFHREDIIKFWTILMNLDLVLYKHRVYIDYNKIKRQCYVILFPIFISRIINSISSLIFSFYNLPSKLIVQIIIFHIIDLPKFALQLLFITILSIFADCFLQMQLKLISLPEDNFQKRLRLDSLTTLYDYFWNFLFMFSTGFAPFLLSYFGENLLVLNHHIYNLVSKIYHSQNSAAWNMSWYVSAYALVASMMTVLTLIVFPWTCCRNVSTIIFLC